LRISTCGRFYILHLGEKKNLTAAELFYSRKKKSLFAKELLTSGRKKKISQQLNFSIRERKNLYSRKNFLSAIPKILKIDTLISKSLGIDKQICH